MKTTTTTIRPGLLVAVKSSVQGGVAYQRVDLENEPNRSRWETTREVADPAEHERAWKLRAKLIGAIRGVCIQTSFGLLCPVSREERLDDAVAEAMKGADEHNATAEHTFIRINVLKGRVSESDTQAARAIATELGELVATMNGAIDRADPKAIRDAANRARQLSAMLSEKEQETAREAIKAARAAATAIVKRVEKAGEVASTVLAELDRSAIEKARISFLDLDASTAPAEALPAVQVQRFADIGEEAAAPAEPPATEGKRLKKSPAPAPDAATAAELAGGEEAEV